MLKQTIAIILLVAFAAQTFNRAVIQLDYYANTASFAKNCENKAKPMMHCNGKCQMMKKLKEEEKKDQQNPNRKTDNKDEVVYLQSPSASISFFRITVSVPFSLFADTQFPKGIYNDIFHPPTV